MRPVAPARVSAECAPNAHPREIARARPGFRLRAHVSISPASSDSSIENSLISPISTFILAAVVSDQPYLNSARTLADSRVLLIPAPRVRAVFDQDVAFARIVARELAFAYRSAIKKLKGNMSRSSVERLTNWILSEARKDPGQSNIVVPFDRGTLASHIGTTHENLSRSLAQLTEHGVRIRGREIVIDRQDMLEAFARPQRLIDDPSV